MLFLSLILLAMLLSAQTFVWLISIKKHDASIVDIFWGTGFVLLALLAFIIGDGTFERRTLLAVLVSIWGLRLTAYLAWRNSGKEEDYRYRSMRRQYGPRFPLLSLFIVFWFQGFVAWLISFPIQASAVYQAPLSWLDLLGVLFWFVGLLFESMGDWQLAKFKADPNNQSRVMNRGLWKYTRHPNYFGDFLVWWGFGCIALSAGAPWTLFGPALMSLFLLKVSGVALLEKTITQRRPEYEDYIKKTSAFFPWFPTGNETGNG
jgi:steroid 5-alpha reductase family enzyme